MDEDGILIETLVIGQDHEFEIEVERFARGRDGSVSTTRPRSSA